jgi:hypothetical protein
MRYLLTKFVAGAWGAFTSIAVVGSPAVNSSFLAAAVLESAAISSASADTIDNLIVNGGFETGDFTGWTVLGGALVTRELEEIPGQALHPHFGNYFAAIGTISQTISDLPGQIYQLTYFVASPPSLAFTLFSEFHARWNGQAPLCPGGSFLCPGFGQERFVGGTYGERTFHVVGTGSDVLQLSGIYLWEPCADPRDFRTCTLHFLHWAVDDVSLVPVPGPVAGAGLPALVLACGGLFGWWVRRQKIA